MHVQCIVAMLPHVQLASACVRFFLFEFSAVASAIVGQLAISFLDLDLNSRKGRKFK